MEKLKLRSSLLTIPLCPLFFANKRILHQQIEVADFLNEITVCLYFLIFHTVKEISLNHSQHFTGSLSI